MIARNTRFFARAAAVIVLGMALIAPLPGRAGPPRSTTRISGKSPFPRGCGEDLSFIGTGFRNAEVEPSAAVNPMNPRNIIATWIQDEFLSYVVGVSKDGGASWREELVPGISRCTGGAATGIADPWVSIGPDGTAYLAGFSIFFDARGAPVPTRSTLNVSRSTNGGVSWSAPSVVTAGAVLFHDKPAITADPRIRGSAYLVWTEEPAEPLAGPVAGLFFSRTSDGGRTWSPPTPVFVPPIGPAFGGRVLVLPDGSLLVVFTNERTSPLTHLIDVARSDNGGLTWSPPTTIAEIPAGNQFSMASCPTPDAPIRDPHTSECVQVPEYVVSSESARNGTAYVAWRHPLSSTAAEIRLSKSKDEGRTWSAPVRVSTARAQTFLPSVAVAPDGTVGVMYDDLRNDVPTDNAITTDVWFAQSHDGGASWHETHVAGPFDMRSAPVRLMPANGRFIGDYDAGLMAIPGGFGAVFVLAKPQATAGATDMFFARMSGSS